MPARRLSVRPLVIALCSAWLALAGLPVAAELPALKAAVPKKGDAHAEKTPDRAPEKAPEKATETAAGAHGGSAQDPMDRLRERLAEKLGATKAPDHANPNVLRVVSRSGGATESAHGAAAPSAAAKLAAAHRAAQAGPAAEPAAGGHAPHWDYQGDAGPEGWGALKPEFASCATGKRQSPIDIRDGIKVQLEPVQFDYKASGFRVIDNGHTVQVNVGAGNSIEVMGRRFELLQFHFHRPSEERINGRQFDMVVHLVHKDLDGRLAVIAVLLDRGSIQPLVQTIWNNLPLEKGDEVAAKGAIDLNALLPAERSYYTYMGSLTTPPCSEGVLWMVMKNPVPIAPEQIAIFARLYPMNARPIQSAAGRLIKESN